MAKVIIAGGTGMIGTLLCKMLLEKDHEVVILSTKKNATGVSPEITCIFWNPEAHYIDPSFKAENCILINLAGASVADERWSNERKKVIVQSRVQSLQTLYKAVESGQIKASRLVSASAIGYYAESKNLLSEDAPPDNSFLSLTCRQWEEEASLFRELPVSTAIVRIGIVLSRDGGALKTLLNPLRYGIAAIPGYGNQIMSWIHIEDMCRMLIYLMDHVTGEGIYNAVADKPVSANELFKVLLNIRKKGISLKIHIPPFVLKIVLGEMSAEILKSGLVSNAKIRQSGFDFKYKTIEKALTDLLEKT